MKIDKICVFKYSIPFHTPIHIKDKQLNSREGYLLKILDDTGNIGWGEIAPLYGFSEEKFDFVLKEITELKRILKNEKIPIDIIQKLNPYSASVRFGFETALLNLIASEKKLSLAGFLNPTAYMKIEINALLDGDSEDLLNRTKMLKDKGFKTFKLKIGRNNIDEELKLTKEIIEIIKPYGNLRLDANQSLNPKSPIINNLTNLKLEYLEEPFKSFEETKTLIEQNSIPIALDESLKELQPDDLNKFKNLKAIVIKPTMLGYTKSMAFATKAMSLGITPVISSSFESPVGIYILASMSAIIDNQAPAGLETINRFDNQILPDIDISEGFIDLLKYQNFYELIDTNNLEELLCD